MAYVSDELDAAGIFFQGGLEKSKNLRKKNTSSERILHNLISADDKRHLQGNLPDLVLDYSLPPGQPSNSLDGYRHLGELKTLSQRNKSVEKRAEHIQLDLNQNVKDLDARDPRNTVLAEMKSYDTEEQYIALVAGRYGEFSRDFVKMRNYIASEKAYACNEHFNSSVNMAMSMLKLSITSRWALMAARGWARLILGCRCDLINDHPCATAAEAPLDEAHECYHFDNPIAHTNGAYQHSEAA